MRNVRPTSLAISTANNVFRAEHVPRLGLPRARWLACLLSLALVQPAFAGPPYLSDDPEPTPYRHFEIYAFGSGTRTHDGTDGAAGIDFNYGAAPDLQLTATLPIGFAAPADDQANVGFGNIELGAKYRFLHQSAFGLDVSIFPRLFVPTGSSSVSDNHVSILLPVWLQKDWDGSWSLFGGGGCVLSTFAAQDFCLAGAVVTHQFVSNLQLGVELFHQTADANGTLASTSVGLGATYDLNQTYHLLGYVNRGVQNANQTNQFSFYFAVLFTF